MAIITYTQEAPLAGLSQYLWSNLQLPPCPTAAPQQTLVIDPAMSAEAWDNLALSAYASASGLTVRFQGEYQLANGTVQHFARDIVPTSDRAATTATMELPVSKLLSMTAILAGGTAKRGQAYVRARAQRATGSGATLVQNLLTGYVSNAYSPSWPTGTQDDPLTGPGYLYSETGTNPAAGAEMVITVPTGARWRIIALCIVLTTAAGGSDRLVHVDFKNGSAIMLRSATPRVQPPAVARNYNLGNLTQIPASVSLSNNLNIPDNFLLPAGTTITTSTSNMGGSDNYDAPTYLVEEWLEP